MIIIVLLNFTFGYSQTHQLVKFNIDSIRQDTGNYANNISEDNAGNKWFNKRNGILSFDNKTYSFYKLPDKFFNSLNSFSIKNFAANNSNKICLNFLYKDLYNKTVNKLIIFDNINAYAIDTINQVLPVKTINDIKFDKRNTLWIATDKGLVAMIDSIWTIFDTQTSDIPSDTIYKIEIDNKNNKWLRTPKGIIKYDGNNWIKYFNAKPDIYKIDNLGNIWYSSEATGYVSIRKFDGISWSNYWIFSWSGGAQYHITAIETDTLNNIWFSVYEKTSLHVGSLLHLIYNGKDWKIDNSGIGYFPPNSHVYSIKSDEKNNIWIGADNNLWVYNIGGVKLAVPENIIPDTEYGSYISAYPNPFGNTTNISYKTSANSLVSITITDITGRIVKAILNKKYNAGIYNLDVNTDDLTKGIYFLSMTTDKGTLSRKIIKN